MRAHKPVSGKAADKECARQKPKHRLMRGTHQSVYREPCGGGLFHWRRGRGIIGLTETTYAAAFRTFGDQQCDYRNKRSASDAHGERHWAPSTPRRSPGPL